MGILSDHARLRQAIGQKLLLRGVARLKIPLGEGRLEIKEWCHDVNRTRALLTTDFKSVSRLPNSSNWTLPSRIYRRLSRQSKLRQAWYEHITPSSSPHQYSICTNLPLELTVLSEGITSQPGLGEKP